MSFPSLVVLQSDSTAEIRTARLACLLKDIPVINCSLQGLDAYRKEFKSGTCLPIGSVEFVRQAMKTSGIAEPKNLSYPEGTQRFLGRHIRRIPAGEILGTWFVKPVATKQFTGFVFDTLSDEQSYSEADRESLHQFMMLPADTPMWISEPVTFRCEWRYYVMHGQIIGSARYDPNGADDAPTPDMRIVAECIAKSGITTPFALDMGVLDNGSTVLVECNDAWSLGYYSKALEPSIYLQLLSTRWSSFFEDAQADVFPGE